MNKYNDYGEFLCAVINSADKQSNYPLSVLYGVKSETIEMIKTVLQKGWLPFLSLYSIISSGVIASFFSFFLSPIGLIIRAALDQWQEMDVIRTLNENGNISNSIRAIGDKYKTRFESHIEETKYIDNLIEEASLDLIQNASTPSEY